MDTVDWRSQLPPGSRQRIVNKMMEYLMKHLPSSGEEGLNDIKIIAEGLEEKIYYASTSQTEYLGKIAVKILTMETRPKNSTLLNSLLINRVDGPDWITQARPDLRQQVVNKIMDTLKRHPPSSGQDEFNEIKKIAERFEEKIFTSSTSESDYIRKLSLKMLTMETKSPRTVPNSQPTNHVGSSNRLPDSGSLTIPLPRKLRNDACAPSNLEKKRSHSDLHEALAHDLVEAHELAKAHLKRARAAEEGLRLARVECNLLAKVRYAKGFKLGWTIASMEPSERFVSDPDEYFARLGLDPKDHPIDVPSCVARSPDSGPDDSIDSN